MMRTVAIVNMVYNEPELLPIWLKYYKGHFGDQACYIVDHGVPAHIGSTTMGKIFVCHVQASFHFRAACMETRVPLLQSRCNV
jgi:hypothetical protein